MGKNSANNIYSKVSVTRMVVLLLYCIANEIQWMLEQPSSSLLHLHNSFHTLGQTSFAKHVHGSLWCKDTQANTPGPELHPHLTFTYTWT